MTTPTQELCEKLRSGKLGFVDLDAEAIKAADLLEAQAARIAELDLQREQAVAESEGYKEQHARDSAELRRACAARDEAKNRIAALEAKCALLAASLGQEEKRSAGLEAQLRERGEPVYQVSYSNDDGWWDAAEGVYKSHPEHMRRVVWLNNPAAASDADWKAVCAEAYAQGHRDGEAETRAPAAAASEEDRRDAQRYRLVRRGQRWSTIDGAGNTLRAESLDAAIDAAIDAQAGSKEGA